MSMTVVRRVDPRSPAHRAGVRPGDTLLEINGTPIVDVLDYKFYSYDPRLELTLLSSDGTRRTVHVRKEEGQDLGLDFETYLMDRARSCANNCIFCFVDQMPPGMRETLYFKDDDARLSFLMGNYLTLTNLSKREVQRIIDLHISPINVSVHTTDPQLRVEMLKNKRAGESIDVMRRFAAANITMNCQIVSCPGVNDGPALDRTLRELSEMYPGVASVAIVPVGVTKFREGLCPIAPYTKEQAAAVIAQVEAFGKQFMEKEGTRLAWCSDEFYLLAGLPLPEKSFYEDMAQLENGACSGCFSARRTWRWMSRSWASWSPSRWPPVSPRRPLSTRSSRRQNSKSPSFRDGSIPSVTASLERPSPSPAWSPARTLLPN